MTNTANPNHCSALHAALVLFQLSDADLALVRELRPVLEEKIDTLLEGWLQHWIDSATLPAQASSIPNPELRKNVLSKNRRCLLTLGDPIDFPYLELRITLGRDAQRIGVSSAQCLAGAAYFSTHLCDIAQHFFAASPETIARAQHAIAKLLFFDAQYIMQGVMETRETLLHEAQAALETRYENQSQTLRETVQRAHAAEALASIAGLVSGLAHEIGTPMNVIQGHAELLELSAQNDKDRKRLQTIQIQVGRIAKIIQALLKMAHGEKEIAGPLDLHDAIKTSLGFLDEKFRKRGIRVVAELEPVPAIEGDTNRIRQLFLNLFLNAADAMQNGGELHITLATQGDRIQSSVTDNGVGIREQDLAHVFEPFFTSKEAGHGHGLGLVVAKEIVEDHAGQIAIESTPNGGTQIRLSFPILHPKIK